ncbi:Xaa-Pro aminopeptidase [Stella humosa]|uniref:Xaa-Pro aminopeptidase n=1 Tax=Stella humosa TaxID=94 RepID=A0A3N1MAK5_9PROT|nr:M24 family metallopeptidase [Stella humosa]ROQ00299.1 Xaa-Pro aminopeptidase [Stella humosa]BBK30463.1 dipeptidase [Stella humosa]
MPGLSDAVRRHRLDALRRAMDQADVAALALSGAEWFEFATNLPLAVQAWERPFLVVVPRDGPSAAILPRIAGNRADAQRARGNLWLDRIVHYGEQPRQSGRLPLLHQWPELVAGVLADLGLSRARVGVDAAGALAQAAGLLPQMRVVPAARELRPVRLVKHPEEIAAMTLAAGIADAALARYADEIRPGRLLGELDHRMAAAAMVDAARLAPGRDFQILRFLSLSGPAAASPHGDGAQSAATALDDTTTVTICNVRLDGLSIEDQRTFVLGRPPAELCRAVDTAHAATAAGLAAVVAGKPLCGVDEAAQAVIERAGFGPYLLHRTGHGIGVGTHEIPEDMPFDPRPILAGEVLVVEPGIYIPGVGAARFVDVAVAGRRATVLTQANRNSHDRGDSSGDVDGGRDAGIRDGGLRP